MTFLSCCFLIMFSTGSFGRYDKSGKTKHGISPPYGDPSRVLASPHTLPVLGPQHFWCAKKEAAVTMTSAMA